MSTYFTSKLPATHAFGRGNRASLLNILRAHSLLSPAHKVVGPVPVCKEQCAALLCLDAATISVVALKQLSPDACISLCTMLGLSAMPVAPQAQADRIFKHVTDKRTADAAAAAGQQGGPASRTCMHARLRRRAEEPPVGMDTYSRVPVYTSCVARATRAHMPPQAARAWRCSRCARSIAVNALPHTCAPH